ncbi:hypothetical protein Q0O85_26550 [Priestia megaterium]|uniref:hypothetical protein n=1 Tax=Priestia megaterium TaxID=1404 RepID=UPI00345833FB
MKFNYYLNGYGWAQAFIEIDSKKLEFTPSYLSDAFGDLLRSLVSLLIHEEEVATVVWDEEPSGVEWTFVRKNSDELSIKITLYEETYEINKQKGKVVLHTDCLFIEFIKEVVREADQLLISNGILGYRNIWDLHEFPISSYLQLKDFLKNDMITIENSSNSRPASYKEERSNFKQELHLLHSLVRG